MLISDPLQKKRKTRIGQFDFGSYDLTSRLTDRERVRQRKGNNEKNGRCTIKERHRILVGLHRYENILMYTCIDAKGKIDKERENQSNAKKRYTTGRARFRLGRLSLALVTLISRKSRVEQRKKKELWQCLVLESNQNRRAEKNTAIWISINNRCSSTHRSVP